MILYTLYQFKKMCDSGCFIDDDGVGFYARNGKKSDKGAVPSNIRDGRINFSYTHVAWFNK